MHRERNAPEENNESKIEKQYVNYSYDSRLDTIRIEVKQKYKYKESIDLKTGVYLDFNDEYLPVNLEIMDASKRMGVSKEFLASPSGNVKITTKRDLINLDIILENNNENGFLNLNTFGEEYIPDNKTVFMLI